MTFLELCKKTREEIGLSGVGPTTVVGQKGQLAQLIGFVQAADMLIQNLWADWGFLWDEVEIPTVVNQETYSSPATLGQWDYESFYIGWGTEKSSSLYVLDNKEDLKWSRARSTGTPFNIILLPNKNIKLNPIPDAVYTVSASFYKKPVMLVNNADVSAIPEQFHRVIIARAKMLYAEAEEIYNQMAANKIEYQEGLKQLEAHSLHGRRNHWYADTEQLVVRPV